MQKKFIKFTSDYFWVNNLKTWRSAELQLNEWLKENPTFEVVHWQAVSIGKDNQLCLVVEYKERKYVVDYN